jgi:hypothetical protein
MINSFVQALTGNLQGKMGKLGHWRSPIATALGFDLNQ